MAFDKNVFNPSSGGVKASSRMSPISTMPSGLCSLARHITLVNASASPATSTSVVAVAVKVAQLLKGKGKKKVKRLRVFLDEVL